MLSSAIIKEFKLVFRDLHSVLVLFAMPAVFIIIMSLAMQDQFSDDSDFKLKVKFHVVVHSPENDLFIERLNELKYFQFSEVTKEEYDLGVAQGYTGKEKAFVFIPAHIFNPAESDADENETINVTFSPEVYSRTSLLIKASIGEAYSKTMLTLKLPALGLMGAEAVDALMPANVIKTAYRYEQGSQLQIPTAVQQSVPAWLIFSMFFVVIPISTTLITERQQGTLSRLRTMPTSMLVFLIAKILPYLLINQVQLVIMLMLGIYLVPLLGGDQLVVGGSFLALALMSLATGFAAVGYGLLVAVIAKSTEQATAIGGVGNILLAAIGGIMVPKFVMPEYLQELTQISPMAWGLEGFLDILLRNGNIFNILFEVGMLFVFGFVLLSAALLIAHRRL